MKQETLSSARTPELQKITVDWAESDWFQIWLQLARRDYQGDTSADRRAPSWFAHAAAG